MFLEKDLVPNNHRMLKVHVWMVKGTVLCVVLCVYVLPMAGQ